MSKYLIKSILSSFSNWFLKQNLGVDLDSKIDSETFQLDCKPFSTIMIFASECMDICLTLARHYSVSGTKEKK